MEFARLMVTVDLSPIAADRVRLASGLAKQWGATLIGVAASEIRFPNFLPARPLDPRVLDALEARAEADLEEAKALLFREVDETVRPTWRSEIASSIEFSRLERY